MRREANKATGRLQRSVAASRWRECCLLDMTDDLCADESFTIWSAEAYIDIAEHQMAGSDSYTRKSHCHTNKLALLLQAGLQLPLLRVLVSPSMTTLSYYESQQTVEPHLAAKVSFAQLLITSLSDNFQDPRSKT